MIRVRRMTFEDLGLGLRLKQENGWNQTPADWARFLSLQPDGCFVAEEDGEPAGTVTTCILGSLAWVGMMLVEEKRRGRGLGRALLTHALGFLEERRIRSVRLDATPRGEPLYRQFGFVEQFSLTRFEGDSEPGQPVLGVEAAQKEHWLPAAALDQQVTNTDRRALLLELFRERPTELHIVLRGGAVVGYATARRGTRAWQIGPCLGTAEAAPLLLSDALNRLAGLPCFVDVPLPHTASAALVRSRGLREQRRLLRMCRGEDVREAVQQMWASSGPEKG